MTSSIVLPSEPVIVTGGGQGLGRAFCDALARAGAHAIVADIDADRARSVATEVRKAGNRASAVFVDVSDESSVKRMLDEVRREHGPPFALINNAAVFSTLSLGPSTEISASEWRRVLDVNLTGAFLCCREVVPLMAARGYGKIINISSATVWTGRPGYLHYVTSKAGLIGLTRSLASEVGPQGIRVNAVTPGSTETEIERATITRETREAMAELTPLRRTQLPADLVGTILFLSAPESDFLTGQTINVDGGLAFH
jgi:3-oxoacyl-[acyl-carrier protein] reductase